MREIKCPACGHEAKNVFDFGGLEDDEAEVECQGCGFKYVVTVRVLVYYTTRCAGKCKFNARLECKTCGNLKGPVTM